MATAKPKLKRIKIVLVPGAKDATVFTSRGRIRNGSVVDLPEDEAAVFIEREQAYPSEQEESITGADFDPTEQNALTAAAVASDDDDD